MMHPANSFLALTKNGHESAAIGVHFLVLLVPKLNLGTHLPAKLGFAKRDC